MSKKFSLVIFLIFSFCSSFAWAQEVTTISILNAKKTEYIKNEETGNETIHLEGSVELSVTKGSTKTSVKAQTISYDRVTKMLFAEGAVELSTDNGSHNDHVYASSLIMNTSTLEGVFDDGRVLQTESDALNLPSGSTLVVFSDLFGKSENNTFAFKNSSLTFCDDEDPHWHINSSRLWLLPGGEFAFLNALLYVGPVPVMYFPAFYLPKDELVFNPVFGYRSRQGYYVQTTTYLIGRKSNSSSFTSSTDSEETDKALESLYNFMKPNSVKEQKLEGLVLHNLDQDFTGNTSSYLRVIGDWYTNSGALVGLEGNFNPKIQAISKIAFDLDIGFSNVVFKNGEIYSRYSPYGNYYYEKSSFLGMNFPFRFKGKFEFSLSKPFSLSLSMPFYSDPFFPVDFSNRSESLNWISTIQDLMNKNSATSTGSEVSSFSWNMNTSYQVPLPKFINPWVSSASLSTTSTLSISSKNTTTKVLKETFEDKVDSHDLDSYIASTSARRFFYPSHANPGNIKFSLSGKLFKYPPDKKSETKSTKSQTQSYPVTLVEEGQPGSDVKDDQTTEENQTEDLASDQTENTESQNAAEVDSQDINDFLQSMELPDIAFTPSKESTSSFAPFTYSLDYSFSGDFVSQYSFSSDNLLRYDDFDWKNFKSFMYTYKMPASVTQTLTAFNSMISASSKLSYNSLWQEHPYLNDDLETGGYTEKEINKIYKNDYMAESQKLVNSNTVSVKPVKGISFLEDTAVVWSTALNVLNKKIDEDELWDGSREPNYDYKLVDFEDMESVTSHNVSVVLGGTEFDKKIRQSLTFTANLPPQLDKYSGTLALTFPFVNTSVSTGFEQKSKDDETFKKLPVSQNMGISVPLFGSNLSLTENFSYNLEDDNPDSLKISLSYKSFSSSFTMSYTNGYDFNKGWTARTEKEFLPYSFSLNYSPQKKTFYSWKNRIQLSPSFSTSVVADLLRPTNSYLNFSPSLTFRLNELLDLTFSSTSRNSVLYRYIQKFDKNNNFQIPGESNIFVDLFNSFAFYDESKRRASGFKIKSLNVEISHHLHDWKFQYKMRMEPRLITDTTGKKTYDFNPLIEIGIVWNPMDSIKTKIIDKYGEWSFN